MAMSTPSKQSDTAMLLIVRIVRRRLRKAFLATKDMYLIVIISSG